MKVLMINIVCGSGSTGRIVADMWSLLKEQGHEAKITYGFGTGTRVAQEDMLRFNTKFGYYRHNIAAKLTDRTGLYSARQTKRLVEYIKRYDPDVIHLHNLHGYYINYKVLFDYLAQAGKPVVWTLHDCWAFTGHCAYFTAAGCEQWKTHCSDCASLGEYPVCYLKGDVYNNFETKKRAFTSVENMTIVTPSKWLGELVRESFLNKYPVEVIHNGIDLSVFRPKETDFKQRHGIADKTMVLAVANVWEKRKGLDDVLKLAEMLGEDYQIVIVGLSEKQAAEMPENIIAIQRTSSVDELVEIYSAADVFVNPSYEETFSLVNIEALACGTPIVAYPTGIAVELDGKSGCNIVPVGDMEKLYEVICTVDKPERAKVCQLAQAFSAQEKYNEYIKLYEILTKKSADCI